MKKIFIIAMALVLTGCSEQNYYSKEGVTGEQMAKDVFDCALKIGNLNNQKMPIARLEQLCMKSKGYKIHEGALPDNFEDITKK